MDDSNVLEHLDRVTAPPGFENRVMAELSLRRRTRMRVRRAHLFRLGLSGAAAGVLVTFAVLHLFVPDRGASDAGGVRAAASRDSIPVTESVDYGREIRSSSAGSRTVFLLEQVSDASYAPIRY